MGGTYVALARLIVTGHGMRLPRATSTETEFSYESWESRPTREDEKVVRRAKGHRGTGAQGHRGTGAKGHRGTGAQGHRWSTFGSHEVRAMRRAEVTLSIT